MNVYVINPTRDVVWQDDGDGRRIVQWNVQLGTPPAEADGARLVDVPLQVKDLAWALAEGERYVRSYFPEWQQTMMTVLLTLGTPSQITKLQAIYEWIAALQAQAFTNPTTFEPSGAPPFLYEQVILEL